MTIKGFIETSDLQAIAKGFSRLPEQLIKQGRQSALLRALNAGRAEGAQQARREFRIKSSDMKKEVFSKPRLQPGLGEISLKDNRISLGYFLTKSNQTNFTKGTGSAGAKRRKGVRVAVRKGQGTKLITGAFVIPRDKLKRKTGLRGAPVAVFVRSKRDKKKLRNLFSVSGAEMIRNSGKYYKGSRENFIMSRMTKVLEERLVSNYRFYESQILSGNKIGKKFYSFR